MLKVLRGSVAQEIYDEVNELSDWPPQWQPLILRSTKVLTGEIGLFKSVRPLYASDDYLVLTMVHESIDYTGLLHVDPIQKRKITTILDAQKGRSIEEIGKLEIYTEL